MSTKAITHATDADAVLVVALLDHETAHLERRIRENKLNDARLAGLQRKSADAYQRIAARLRADFNLPTKET